MRAQLIQETSTLAYAQPEIRPNAVYTLSEVCQILKISDATVRRWLKSGQIRSAKVGRAYRILGSQLLEALEYPRVA